MALERRLAQALPGRNHAYQGVIELRGLKVLGVATSTALVLLAVMATSAVAVELPEFKVETGFTGKTGAVTFEGKEEKATTIKCASSTFEGSAADKGGGAFHFDGSECLSAGLKCNSSGDAAGVILLSGEWRFATKGAKEAFLLIVLSAAHVVCSAIEVELKGSLLAPITPLTTETVKYELSVKGSKGKQEFTEYTNDGGGKVTAQLLEKAPKGVKFEEIAASATEARITTAKSTQIVLKTPTFGFETEKGWSAEAKGGGEFDITEEAKVKCEKETFEGASPASGFASKSDLAPKYSGCLMEITKEAKTTTTKATVESRGCDFEYLGSEEPGSDKFKSELDISNCTGGESGGILISDKELEAGKTCEVNIPDQAMGKEDESTDTVETAPFEAQGKVDATDLKGESKECPPAIESGKEPLRFFISMVMIMPNMFFFGFIWFSF